MSFTTREPTVGDAPEIADLHVATWREAYAHLLPSDFFSDSYIAGRQRMWDQVLGQPGDDVAIRVAVSDGAIIGFAWVGPTAGSEDGLEDGNPPRERQVYALYLAKDHYGGGAAQALLNETLGWGPALLWVAKENPRAIAFYRRNGFEFDGVERRDPSAPSITDARMLR